jgi:hypothetical protein
MTEKEIELLRFEKEWMSEDDEMDDYYYAYDVADGLSLISNAKSDSKGGQWYVEIFNTDPKIRFHEYGEVQALLNQLESRIVKK